MAVFSFGLVSTTQETCAVTFGFSKSLPAHHKSNVWILALQAFKIEVDTGVNLNFWLADNCSSGTKRDI